jgi:hypothetical protein
MHHFELGEQPDLHHSTVRPFTAPIAGQLRTILTRAPQRRDSAASGLPRKLHLKIGTSKERTIERRSRSGSSTRPRTNPTATPASWPVSQRKLT